MSCSLWLSAVLCLPVVSTADDAVPLTERGLQNVQALTRLMGYVQHFHPSDGVRATDWNAFAVDAMEAVEAAADAEELAGILNDLFFPLAPSVEVWDGLPEDAFDPVDPTGDGTPTHRVGVLHVGLGPELLGPDDVASPRSGLYRSMVVELPLEGEADDGAPDVDLLPVGSVLVEELPGGVTCRVPLGLVRDQDGTLPRGMQDRHDGPATRALDLTANRRAVRLAAVAEAWNTLQHFYPYFDVVDVDWSEVLTRSLNHAARDRDERELLVTLETLIGALGDGHGNVYHDAIRAAFQVPVVAEWVGGELIVRWPLPEVADAVHPGDAILAINGAPVQELYRTQTTRVAYGTEGWLRHKSIGRILSSETAGEDQVTLQSIDGTERTVTLARVQFDRYVAPRPSQGEELASGIVYFDLDGTDAETLEEQLPTLAAARGIVLDMRGYPGAAGAQLFPYLRDELTHSAWWNVPTYRRPDQIDAEFARSHWNLEPQEPRINAELVWLTDGRAISYAESCMGIVEAYGLGEILGAPTAGANGNINFRQLPGGYRIIWTGMKVTKHDDSTHHRVGILPTIPATPTRQGIADGRDELLELAVATLQEKLGESHR